VSRRVVHWCRAMSFADPCGPWRFGHGAARRDLIAMGLGEYADGVFYATVPGWLQVRSEWMSFEEADELSRAVQSRDAAEDRKRLAVTNQNDRVRRVSRARHKPRGIKVELLESRLVVAVHDDVKATRK
jgi:hypothetical protein